MTHPPSFPLESLYGMEGFRNVDGVLLSAKKDTEELRQLINSLGHSVIKEFIQTRKNTTPFYLGEGKIEEARKYMEENGINMVFVNDALKPSQWFNLEKNLGAIVYDRIRIILEIFAQRAKKKEAMLQVRLARLRYEKPFVRELFHRVKEGEKPGFLAGGEYVVDDYYEMMKKQTKKIREELKKIEEEREIRRKERKEKGFYLVSLAGYTNAGKSSLLNILTDEEVLVEGRLFSTLSTKTSKLKIKEDLPILVTDTVGFIKDLPHWLIDAFHSTLEEISLADIVILVVDGKDDMRELKEKTSSSLKEIYFLREKANIIIALNKIDLLKEGEIQERKKFLESTFGCPCIPVSSLNGTNIDSLVEKIYEFLPPACEMILKIPAHNMNGFLRWLNRESVVKKIIINDSAFIQIKSSQRLKEKIIGKCKKMGGEVEIYEN